ncbi:hypothetical protein K491DRAFT_683211 [Lophiostoma macrostomum CBS 122681]|uniref:Uncharacterized protein n=1 Tax=Lophiostoma macrostomum CBS 122681 TaxID=1314788 RepID=A0A6A6SQQ4_9PLEO|nr:hypothetical protein K491DRAFT_683211 [Lophiostoma macrostomum CBS 122681]
MIGQSEYATMKEKIVPAKELFQTRRYIQCAALCQQLLTQSTEIHPLHHAYLNFYIALSHDTMAREASIRNRHVELTLAEKHYLAAIASLSTPDPGKLEDIQEHHSPTSSSGESDILRRRGSDAASDHSAFTVATSIADDEKASDSDSAAKTHDPVQINDSVNFKTPKRRPSPIRTSLPNRQTNQYEEQFAADLSSFTTLIKSHLADVRALTASTDRPMHHRSSFTRSRTSTISSRPVSRDSTLSESSLDQTRWARKSMGFRPRFDPTSIQKLCSEALSEL